MLEQLPTFLARPPETRPLAEINRIVQGTLRLPTGEPTSGFVDDAALRRQADRMWREWMPTRTETTRPQLRSILKRLRAQAEAKGKPMAQKTTDKADWLRRTREKNFAETQAKGATVTYTRAALKPSTSKAPATPEPITPKESTVKKKSKTKKPAKRKASGEPTKKVDLIRGLLTRAAGCTQADVLAATGWPSVSMPQQAASLGIALKTEKEGRVTRYRAA